MGGGGKGERSQEEVNFPETEGGSKIVYFPGDKATRCVERKRDRENERKREREERVKLRVRQGRVSFPTLSERHVRVPVQFYDVIVY